jgi:murein DD-endopeptidase MepM/ murein hydrolase activator NlpD
MRRTLVTALILALVLVGCSNEEQAQNNTSATNESTQGNLTIEGREGALNITITTPGEGAQELTPILAQVPYAPIPFAGSDGRTHLVYELLATNFSSGKTTIEQLEMLDADTDDVISTFDAKEVASNLHPAGTSDTADTLDPSMAATIFLHVTFNDADKVPNRLVERLSLQAAAAPPDQQQITEKVGETNVDRREVVMISPPLKGSNYLAADSCCDAPHIHRKSPLPINGQFTLAQRYAVDYEQLDANNRVYSGEKADLSGYTIYGKEALAVADGTVVKVTDGYPEQNPGVFPKGISLDEADGNSVILDIGGGNYALYAHFQPGSIRVKEGDQVKRGDVLALVGSSGNSLAPHLHFHVMDSPLSLASNGLPYGIDSFTVTGQSAGTDAFNKAEADGTPLEFTPVDPVKTVTEAMPLDQNVVSFE